jgi:hypothetical protein
VICLNAVDERLMGRISMTTLNLADWGYKPRYCSREESEESLKAGGFNHHHGPECVWLMGFFFRVSMIFRRGVTGKMKGMLAHMKKEQLESWASSLPETDARYRRGPSQQSRISSPMTHYSRWSTSSIVTWKAPLTDLMNDDLASLPNGESKRNWFR